MAGSRKVAGVVYFKINGTQYSLSGDLTVAPQRKTRTGVTGLSHEVYFKEEAHVPYIEGTFFLTKEVSIKAIEAMEDETVTAELVTGQTFILSNAWCANEIVANLAEGTAPIRFEGADCKEMT